MLSETIKVRPKNGPPIEKKRTFGDFLDRISNPDGSPIQAPTLVVVTKS
jgi:hypothetical protein